MLIASKLALAHTYTHRQTITHSLNHQEHQTIHNIWTKKSKYTNCCKNHRIFQKFFFPFFIFLVIFFSLARAVILRFALIFFSSSISKYFFVRWHFNSSFIQLCVSTNEMCCFEKLNRIMSINQNHSTRKKIEQHKMRSIDTSCSCAC